MQTFDIFEIGTQKNFLLLYPPEMTLIVIHPCLGSAVGRGRGNSPPPGPRTAAAPPLKAALRPPPPAPPASSRTAATGSILCSVRVGSNAKFA
mgnify:CR=1 FL=1